MLALSGRYGMTVTAQIQLRILEHNDGKRVLQQKWMGTRRTGPGRKEIIEEWRNVPLVLEAVIEIAIDTPIGIGSVKHNKSPGVSEPPYKKQEYVVTYSTDTQQFAVVAVYGTTMKEAINTFLSGRPASTVLHSVHLNSRFDL